MYSIEKCICPDELNTQAQASLLQNFSMSIPWPCIIFSIILIGYLLFRWSERRKRRAKK